MTAEFDLSAVVRRTITRVQASAAEELPTDPELEEVFEHWCWTNIEEPLSRAVYSKLKDGRTYTVKMLPISVSDDDDTELTGDVAVEGVFLAILTNWKQAAVGEVALMNTDFPRDFVNGEVHSTTIEGKDFLRMQITTDGMDLTGLHSVVRIS